MNETVPDQKYSVCIVGVGARTPVGLTSLAAAAAVRVGIGAIREHPYFVDKAGQPMCVAMDPILSPELSGVERFHGLAYPAAKEALAPWTQLGIARGPIPLVLGLPEPRPGLPQALEYELASRLDRDSAFPSVRTMTIPSGHSAGLMAMEEASRQIQVGQSEFCLAGGVDSYLEAESLEWLDEERQIMSAENRSGFPPGEGAGFCLMTSIATARRYRLDILASVINVATVMEVSRIKTDTICVGEGLSKAILKVGDALKLPEEKINKTYCDLNGERYRSEEFTFTVLRTQHVFVNSLDNVTPADCWGDVGAASGPLFANLAVASGLRGYSAGPRALLWTSSEGGQRSAAIVDLTRRSKGGR